MDKKQKQILSAIAAALVAVLGFFGIDLLGDEADQNGGNPEVAEQEAAQDVANEENDLNVEPDGHYTDAQNVADFIENFNQLPDNYLTKDEAGDLGWIPNEGNLDEVAPGMSIGGDYFGNFEGNLPEADGRTYYEADINYDGGFRNAERLVFSNDGLYFYTDDHYETFEEIEPSN